MPFDPLSLTTTFYLSTLLKLFWAGELESWREEM